MPTTTITNLTPHSAEWRCRYEVVLDDGREVPHGPVTTSTEAEATTRIPEVEDAVVSRYKTRDAEDAVRQGLMIGGYETASVQEVAKAYLKDAFQEDDPYQSYLKLKKFNDFRTDQGWTPAQVKTQLSITDDQWNRLITKWQYLSDAGRVTTMEDYQLIAHDSEEF